MLGGFFAVCGSTIDRNTIVSTYNISNMLRKRLKQLRFLRSPSVFRKVVTSEAKMRLGVPTLRSLEFAVTWACNKRCPFCYAEDLMVSPDRNKEPIAIAKFKDVVLQARGLGLKHINITGGEPFMRKDLFELVASIPEDIIITIATNNLLLTKEKVDRLKMLGVVSLQMSYGKNYENDILRTRLKPLLSVARRQSIDWAV